MGISEYWHDGGRQIRNAQKMMLRSMPRLETVTNKRCQRTRRELLRAAGSNSIGCTGGANAIRVLPRY